MLATTAGMVGFGGLLTAAYARHYSGASPAGTAALDPAAYSLRAPGNRGVSLHDTGTGLMIMGLV